MTDESQRSEQGPGAGPTPAQPSRGPGATPWVLGGVGGFLLAGAVVGVLAATGAVGFGGGQGNVNTDPVEMPESVGDYLTLAGQMEEGGESAESLVERFGRTSELTQEHYSAAFDGAGVGVQSYSDESIERNWTVIAVRAEAPGLLTGPIPDPADLGLEVNRQEVIERDGVECIQLNETVTAGETPDPEETQTGLCQRSEDGLTVMVQGGGAAGVAGQAELISFTNQAYDALSE